MWFAPGFRELLCLGGCVPRVASFPAGSECVATIAGCACFECGCWFALLRLGLSSSCASVWCVLLVVCLALRACASLGAVLCSVGIFARAKQMLVCRVAPLLFPHVFGSTGSARVVFGLTRVVVEAFLSFRCFVVLCGRDSLSQEFVARRSWWHLVHRTLPAGMASHGRRSTQAREDEQRCEERGKQQAPVPQGPMTLDEALSTACRQESEMDQYIEEKKAAQKRSVAPFQKQDRKRVDVYP
ncbi:hypothetical protein Taro_031502 [Colocasia esculenta]|uniref:Uncharacterized protein n=1 Tax=Colocasia esculenta TaxID=4460 RepID=A0A843VQ66_COLES|nr:hypothetical protein [Colocasia esculenta]